MSDWLELDAEGRGWRRYRDDLTEPPTYYESRAEMRMQTVLLGEDVLQYPTVVEKAQEQAAESLKVWFAARPELEPFGEITTGVSQDLVDVRDAVTDELVGRDVVIFAEQGYWPEKPKSAYDGVTSWAASGDERA